MITLEKLGFSVKEKSSKTQDLVDSLATLAAISGSNVSGLTARNTADQLFNNLSFSLTDNNILNPFEGFFEYMMEKYKESNDVNF